MKRLIYFLFAFFFFQYTFAQNYVAQTFKDTRVINAHTVETIQKRQMDIRIGHRFGDLKGGWQTLYGLETAQDVLIGLSYGITDNLSVGLHRTKGAGLLTSLLHGTLKYRVMQQTKESGRPFTLTVVGLGTASTMPKSDNAEVLNFFEKTSHRFSYSAQILLARKFSDRFSLQIAPGIIHRNIVNFDEPNDLFNLGFAARVQITKVLGIIVDANFPFNSLYNFDRYSPAMGIGLEIETGGHVFQINFTNARGIMETDYIPYTRSKWSDGEFRLGFTVSRLFNI